jgi:hypothetical protein
MGGEITRDWSCDSEAMVSSTVFSLVVWICMRRDGVGRDEAQL